MKKIVGFSIVCFLVLSLSVISVFTVSMVGNFSPKVHATAYDDILDICLLTNTYIEDGRVDWDGFLDCIEKAL